MSAAELLRTFVPLSSVYTVYCPQTYEHLAFDTHLSRGVSTSVSYSSSTAPATNTMRTSNILITALSAISALAVPHNQTALDNRAPKNPAGPSIGPGFTEQQTFQLRAAMHDALVLANHVLGAPHVVDPIIGKYFKDRDYERVEGQS